VVIFSVICALLITLGLALVLPPLLHPDRIAATRTTSEANVAVYRGQLAELESDRRHRIITDEQFLWDREELEQRLIVDLSKYSHPGRRERWAVNSSMLMYGLAVGLPLTAVLLYLALGTPPFPLQVP
jgi:cytochrome c-type biogenesis protein CcmH